MRQGATASGRSLRGVFMAESASAKRPQSRRSKCSPCLVYDREGSTTVRRLSRMQTFNAASAISKQIALRSANYSRTFEALIADIAIDRYRLRGGVRARQ